MQLKQILSTKRARLILIGGGILLLLALILIGMRSCKKPEPTPAEVRMRHMDWMAQLIETYKERNGAYPQPTVRQETQDGIRHVWGYRVGTPALASCTIAMREDVGVVAEESHCGGGVFDVDGNLIAWKGTLTAESGLNSVEIGTRGSGRVSSPISDLVSETPVDPLYSDPVLMSQGFGEYVYALSEERDEYQLATTITNPETGEKSTLIRGNYFVRSDESDRMPASLIGPGLLFDEFGNPIEGQEQPFHVLLDGQKEGFPNPLFGDGEGTLRTLTLERSAKRLLSAIDERILFLTQLIGDDAMSGMAELSLLRNDVLGIVDMLAGAAIDVDVLEGDVDRMARELTGIVATFMQNRQSYVKTVLEQEVQSREVALGILQNSFDMSSSAEEAVLVARDEVLNYLDGEGIEEQTRQRVGRKLEIVIEGIPDLPSLFADAGLMFMNPFLSQDLQESLLELGAREALPENMEDSKEEEESFVLVTTLTAELQTHFKELDLIASKLLEDLMKGGAELTDVDASLKNLARALSTENERINLLFDDIADVQNAVRLHDRFVGNSKGDPIGAIADIALLMKQHGQFAPLAFDAELLKSVLLEQSPGVPDIGAYENPLEAEYKGIPYPLP